MPIKLKKEDFLWTNGRGHNQKPILYSQKLNNYGIGKKQHSSDQWWEKAFDNQLKNLDVASADGEVTVTQTVKNVTPVGLERIARFYIQFVRGGVLHGDKEIAEVEGDDEDISTGSEIERKSVRKEKKEKESKDGRKEKGGKDGKRKGREEKEKRKERKLLKRMVKKEMAALKGRQ
ncbi:hypothetical protein L873DRAFT_1786290 [Choiromyces venosus 120613-1]|uniref:Uncharacterized protein n=1 Tax=Choiromyces venosus 120613-1 TaxID=1336337 RepID=A0A3N4K5K2_9PEZI|nr:hypothetical protein L873DRAFT_1786290 [Choiromyces venosus 120613-1]